MWHEFLSAVGISVVAMFPIVNPVGHAPMFFAMTAEDSPEFRRAQAVKTSLWVTAILATSLLLGRVGARLFGISLYRPAHRWRAARGARCLGNAQQRKPRDPRRTRGGSGQNRYRSHADSDADPWRTRLNEPCCRYVNLWKLLDELWRIPIRVRLNQVDHVGQFSFLQTGLFASWA